MNRVLRPDEKAAEEKKRRSENFNNHLKTGAKTALAVGTAYATAGLSAPIVSRLIPLLSEHIPLGLAIKGISKVSPSMGKFLKEGQKMGLNLKDGLDFIKDKIQPKEKEAPIQRQEEQQNNQQEPMQPYAGGHNEPFQGEGALNTIDPNQQQVQSEQGQEQGQRRNIIQQYSPELFQYLSQEIGSGRNPLEAAAIAQNDKRFQGVIAKMQQQTKMKWSDIIAQIFGQQQQKAQGMPQQGQQQQPQAQVQQPMGQGQQGPGQGAQALMSAIQELKKIRGG